MTNIDQLNKLNQDDFVNLLGGIYELSPWVAEESWNQQPFADRESLTTQMRTVVNRAEAERKLALLRAHPDLAGKLSINDELTTESKREQASLGLDRLTAEDFSALSDLNDRYRKRFEFPFIVCVRQLTDLPELLRLFRERMENDEDTELQQALEQVHAIAALRLADIIA